MHQWQGGWGQRVPSQAEQRYISTAWPVEDTKYREVRFYKILLSSHSPASCSPTKMHCSKEKSTGFPLWKRWQKEGLAFFGLACTESLDTMMNHLLINEPFITHCKIWKGKGLRALVYLTILHRQKNHTGNAWNHPILNGLKRSNFAIFVSDKAARTAAREK